MAKRTMGVSRLYFHPRRKPDNLGNVAELPDKSDLLEVFARYVDSEIKPDTLVRRDTETYVTLQRAARKGRSLTLQFESGRFGEDGTIRDVRTHAEIGTYTRLNATAVTTHGVILVPKTGTCALAFTERSAGQGGMGSLLDHFVEIFNARYPEFLMKRQSVVRTEAWLKAAQITKVEGTIRKYRTDTASDGGDVVVGDLSHTFLPPKGEKYLPKKVFDGLRSRRINRARFLGFSAGTELDSVEVTLTDGSQTKTFELGNEKTPNLNLVVATSGQPAPSSSQILYTALSEAPEIFKYYGIEWSEGDSIRNAVRRRTN